MGFEQVTVAHGLAAELDRERLLVGSEEGLVRPTGSRTAFVVLVFPLDVEFGAHPQPRVLVSDDRRGALAEQLFVAAAVVEVPMRIEQHLDGCGSEPLAEQLAQRRRVPRSAAVDEEQRALVGTRNDIAAGS